MFTILSGHFFVSNFFSSVLFFKFMNLKTHFRRSLLIYLEIKLCYIKKYVQLKDRKEIVEESLKLLRLQASEKAKYY
jgi:hypothetical protein